MAEEFEGPSRLHETALFNPVRRAREKAWKQIRAQSPLGPDQWDDLDEAVGIKNPSAELTADSTVTVDSWQEYAETILDDQFVESTVIDQLLGAGFGVSTSLFRYAYFDRLRSERMEADRTMNARSRSVQSMPSHGLHGVPLWVHHVDYEFDSREFQNAMQFGDDLDTSIGQEARRALNRSEHGLLWNGEGREIQTERGTLMVTGLDTDDSLILQASGSNGWINDPNEILADFKELHDTIEDQTDVQDTDDVPLVSQVGGWVFVPRALWGEVDREDYETSATDEPIMERLQRKYPYINIVPAPRLDADTCILLLNDPRYFQIVTAQGVTNTNWEVDGGFGLRNKTLSSRTPFVRRSPDGIRGLVRMTGINA
ncbi:bacteriocin [haloarchaeon 3A1-DGR]|nr:bacteriocin [haloarchaeon 3A1-DGR]